MTGFWGRLLHKTLEADRTMAYGRSLGLSEDAAREVLAAWIEANLMSGMSWHAPYVHRSMEARADEADWDPRPATKRGPEHLTAWLVRLQRPERH